jgi:hypothetical protein
MSGCSGLWPRSITRSQSAKFGGKEVRKKKEGKKNRKIRVKDMATLDEIAEL